MDVAGGPEGGVVWSNARRNQISRGPFHAIFSEIVDDIPNVSIAEAVAAKDEGAFIG